MDTEIDAVYISLSNELHKPWVVAAADAGKHVLCEKPLTLDAREAAEIADHCRDRGVIYGNICQRPTASNALRKCSMVGVFLS
jgi:predicted dehydrogenase